MTRIVGAVMTATVFAATAGPAGAQGFVHPVGGYGHHKHGFSLSVWGGFVPPPPVFGFGPVYPLWAPPVVVPPPVVMVAPPVFGFVEPDFSGGIDLAELREAMKPREDPVAARARVDDAVRRGDLLVVDPKGGAKLAGVIRPAARPEPKPAAVPVVAVKPNPDPIQRAQAAFEAGEFGRAAERLRAAILAKPDAPRPHFLLAQVRTARGQYVEAVEAIRDGVKLDPNWPTAKFRPADFYGAKADRLTTDLAELKAALDAHPDDPTLLFLHGYHLWFGGQRDAAKGLFRKTAAKVQDKEVIERFLRE